MSRLLKFSLFFAAAACSLLHAPAGRAKGVSVYVSAPTVTRAENSNLAPVGSETIVTETFDGTAFGSITKDTALPNPYTSTALNNATLTSTGAPTVNLNSDTYGGYNQGNYLSIPAGAAVTLTLPGAGAGYVGFDFYAGDGNNAFTVYSGSVNLGTYSTANLITLLPNTAGKTVTDVAGGTYQTTAYYGQQLTGKTTFTDKNEPFAYINLFATGENITSIVFRQNGAGAAFETDNFSLLSTEPAVPGTEVYAGQVPEPSTWVCVVAAAVVGLVWLNARRRRARGGR